MRRMDFFGIPITFTGAHRQTYQTKLGGTASVFFVAYMIYISSTQIQQIAFQEKLHIQIEEIMHDTPPTVYVSSDNFMFAVKTNPPVHPFYFFNLHQHSSARNIQPAIELEMCTISHFSKLYYFNERMRVKLLTKNLSEYLCPRFDQVYNISGH